MRSFYVLGLDPSRQDLQAVSDAELDGFDTSQLNRGIRISQIPEGVRLYVSNGQRADSLGNAFGWKIMSTEAISRILEFVPEHDIQLFPLPLFEQENQEPVAGYQLVNNLRLLSASAVAPSNRLIYAHQMVIRESNVPPNVHLFRCTEAPYHWIVSAQLWRRLEPLDGFDATAIQTVE